MNKQKQKNRFSVYFLLVVGVIIFLMPYFYMIVAATQDNQQILSGGINFRFGHSLLANWKSIMARYNYPLVLWNSLVIAV